MKRRGFRGKPSPGHIIWRRGPDGARKQYDWARLERWARHLGLEVEQESRVDHERADEPREQHRVVFKWGASDGETIALGGEEWAMGVQKTPRTFLEIDEAGVARLKGWTFERILDVVELRHDGPDLLLESAAGEKKRLDPRKFATDPRED